MDGQDGNLELNDGQKTHLLSLGLGPDQPAAPSDGDEQRGDLLCDILRRPFPADGLGQGHTSSVAGEPCTAFRTVAGPSLRDLLLDPKTDVSVLRRIKEYAKTLGGKTESDVEKDVHLAIYFTAIVAAIVFHDEYITEHSREDLRGFLDSFIQMAWIPIDLADLLRRAREPRRVLPH